MSDRRATLARFAPLLVLLALAAAVVLGADAGPSLGTPNSAPAADMADALDALPDDGVVVLGFDPDIGTYAEIRPTVRVLLADLLARGVTLAFVSVTPDGRALALAELARIDALEANPRQIVDLGFVPGAEAALVALASELTSGGSDPVATQLTDEALEPDLAVVVGGIDVGPRAWVEQFAPRTEVPLVAVAPAVLIPEVEPYRESGQLAALLATVGDGAAYRSSAELGPLDRVVEVREEPVAPAVAVGVLVALGALGQALFVAGGRSIRSGRGHEPA